MAYRGLKVMTVSSFIVTITAYRVQRRKKKTVHWLYAPGTESFPKTKKSPLFFFFGTKAWALPFRCSKRKPGRIRQNKLSFLFSCTPGIAAKNVRRSVRGSYFQFPSTINISDSEEHKYPIPELQQYQVSVPTTYIIQSATYTPHQAQLWVSVDTSTAWYSYQLLNLPHISDQRHTAPGVAIHFWYFRQYSWS